MNIEKDELSVAAFVHLLEELSNSSLHPETFNQEHGVLFTSKPT